MVHVLVSYRNTITMYGPTMQQSPGTNQH